MCVNENWVDTYMASPLPPPSVEPSSIIAEGRILDAVVARDLHGTVDQLADGLGISASQLRAAISALGAIGWVEATFHGDGQVWLCLGDDLR